MSNDEKTTTHLEAVPAWAVELSRNVVNIRGNVEILTGDMTSMKIDIRALQQFKLDMEAAPKPVTSERVGAMVDVRASQMSLEQDAKVGLLLAAKDEEIAKLRKESATKEDIAKALEEAAKVQTEAIVAGVTTTFDNIVKTPTAQKLKGAIVPVLMIAISIIGLKLTMLLTKLEQTQQAPQQQSTVVQLAPAPALSAHITDAGADQ